MKRITLFLLVAVLAGFTACKPKENKQAEAPLIEKKSPDLRSDLMTPEVLWSFGRLSEPDLSPDKKTILYGVTYYDVAQNKGNRELYTIGTDGQNLKRITTTKFSEYQALWSPDGKKVLFMSAETGCMQVWEMDPDGNNRRQVTNIENGINGFKYSPDGKKILYTADVPCEKVMKDLYAGLPKASGRIMDDLMYRHWDTWVQSTSHIFVADLATDMITRGKDIMLNEPYETPLMPFGGMEQITWSPDSRTIAYTCRKKKGLEYAKSTNSDIYLYDLASGQATNLTEGMMGYDVAPVYSPDGKKIAWSSMEHDGYESDKNRLFVYDFGTRTKTDFSKDFDQNAESMAWTDDSKSIYFISDFHATDEIYRLDVSDGRIAKITEGIHNYTGVIPAGDKLIASRMSMSEPTELFSVNPATGKDTPVTTTNKDVLDKLALARIEQRWIKTTDNKDMQTWVIYPPHFDPAKKYPTLLYCEGGPQSTVSQFWSYRWNFQMMAANNYVIIAPNRRGLPGFGQAWNEEIFRIYKRI